MDIQKLNQEYLFISSIGTFSFLIRLNQSGEIWLFNCVEGCQHILNKKKIKISQIKKIIIVDNHVVNTCGLLGLLSSISLNKGADQIDIYAPEGLHNYIFWGRKYSQTNFRYNLYIHKLSNGLVTNHINFYIHRLYYTNTVSIFKYIFLLSENSGPLNSRNMQNYSIPIGPLFGHLKTGANFVLPDGFLIYRQSFILGYYLGNIISIISR